MADIFISYKKEDRAGAERIATTLRAEGFSIWWDERIVPAEHWDEAIQNEISSAKAVIVLWTPASVKSQWVRAEAEFAKKHGKLVPVMAAECELPVAFMMIQALDLTRWDGTRGDRNWLRLTAWVRDLLAGVAARSGTQEATAPMGADWRAKYGADRNGEPILDGKAVTRSAPAGTLFKDGRDLPLMCVVAPGRFTMGAPASEPDSHVSERPQRQIAVSSPFALGVYAVTFDEWDAAHHAGAVPIKPRDDGFGRGRLPVAHVSWADAQTYVRYLARSTGERYRLPSEAEWEYACRAGADTPFEFGAACSSAHAQFGARRSAEVGSFPPNRFGLYDMHGNIREWTEDLWHDNYSEAPGDAIPWTSGHSGMRVVRGGSWMDAPKFLRSASRSRASESERCGFIGFRVAREIS